MIRSLARLAAPLYELRRRFAGRPHSAELDVTDNCNLACRHCYHLRGREHTRHAEVAAQTWQARLDELRAAGVRFLLLVGGEPALRLDLLAAACSQFPFVYAITNGTIPIPRALRLRLFVSLDGIGQTNDVIRGRGVFERVLANYAGDERVVINMVLSADNSADLEPLVCLSRSQGWRGLVCNLYTPARGDNDPRTLNDDQRAMLVAELRRVKARHPRQLLLSPEMIAWYARADHRDFCYWGDRVLHYDLAWHRRRCFADADCANCGCLGGALQSPRHLLRHPSEMLKLI